MRTPPRSSILRSIPSSVLSATIVSMLALVLIARVTDAANRQSAAPTTVVSINLTRIFAELDETKALRDRLAAITEEMRQRNTEAESTLKQLDDELKAATMGTDRHRDIQEQLLIASADLRGWMEVKSGLRDMEESIGFLKMYDKVLLEAKTVAEAAGYDYVLLDDSDMQIQAGAPEQVLPQLFARRTIYANPARDITTEIVTRMNNAYEAGVGAAGLGG